MLGIRLDSGDLGELSRQARKILDEAGFPDAMIVASNDLDEHAIDALQAGGAEIDVWGVGTKLATCYDQPALGGVYKLSAIRAEAEAPWRPVIKLSEQPIKISNPTAQQVRRLSWDGRLTGDIIYTAGERPPSSAVLPDGSPIDLAGPRRRDLLQPAMRGGRRVREAEPLAAARQRCLQQLPAAAEGRVAARGRRAVSRRPRTNAACAEGAADRVRAGAGPAATTGERPVKLIKVGAAVLNQTPMDWGGNFRRMLAAIESAREQGVSVLCLPELCVTGYGCETPSTPPARSARRSGCCRTCWNQPRG